MEKTKIVYTAYELIKIGLGHGSLSKYLGNGEWIVALEMHQATKHGQCWGWNVKIEGDYTVVQEFEGGGMWGRDESLGVSKGLRIKVPKKVKLMIRKEDTTEGREKVTEWTKILHSDGTTFKIINPKGTLWCSLETAKEIVQWIVPESQEELANMLPQRPEDILRQMEKGLTRLTILDWKVVGHVTLWKYDTQGWGELGSLIVHPDFRGRGIGKALCETFSDAFPNPFQMVATVKTECARYVIGSAGFEVISFDDLREISESAWRECCPCRTPPEVCPKRNAECQLLVRKESTRKGRRRII